MKALQVVLAKATPQLQWDPMVTRAGLMTEDGLTKQEADRVAKTLAKHLDKDPREIEVRKGEKGYVVAIQDYYLEPETLAKLNSPETRKAIGKDLSGIEMERKVDKLNLNERGALNQQLSAIPLAKEQTGAASKAQGDQRPMASGPNVGGARSK